MEKERKKERKKELREDKLYWKTKKGENIGGRREKKIFRERKNIAK